ncbi:2413_t:CDS:2, partial [Scutellospora calospora]
KKNQYNTHLVTHSNMLELKENDIKKKKLEMVFILVVFRKLEETMAQ